jgi:hypothetical protein
VAVGTSASLSSPRRVTRCPPLVSAAAHDAHDGQIAETSGTARAAHEAKQAWMKKQKQERAWQYYGGHDPRRRLQNTRHDDGRDDDAEQKAIKQEPVAGLVTLLSEVLPQRHRPRFYDQCQLHAWTQLTVIAARGAYACASLVDGGRDRTRTGNSQLRRLACSQLAPLSRPPYLGFSRFGLGSAA